MSSSLASYPTSCGWNRPQVQDVPAVKPGYDSANSTNFLTVDHRDSWSPNWNKSASSCAPSGNYDFFLA